MSKPFQIVVRQADTTSTPIRIHVLGGFRIVVDGRELRLRTRKEAMVLLKLALAAPESVRRDDLVGMLWPESSEPRARHSLSEALRGIEQATGLRVKRTVDHLAVGPVWMDLHQLDEALLTGDIHQAERLHVGGFLAGWYAPTPEASYWIDGVAAALHARVERAVRSEMGNRRRATDSRTVSLAVSLLERIGAATEADREAAVEAEQITSWESIRAGETIQPRIPIDREGPFVGRAREMQMLTAELERALAGELRVILIAGEAGIGKTRACQRLARLAALRGARLFLSSCYELEQSVAFGAISEAFAGAVTPSDIAGLKPAWQGILAEVLPEVLRLPGENPLPGIDWETRANWVLQAGALLLDAIAAERTTLLFIDDLQWADSSTIRMLHFMLRKSSPPAGALILLACRQEDIRQNDEASLLVQKLGLQTVELGPMLPAEIKRQVSSFASPLMPADAEFIVNRAGGNPFFARELALTYSGSVKGGSVPWSVRGLVERRISKLDARSRELLELVAVAGGRVGLEVCSRALDRPVNELFGPIATLRHAGLICEKGVMLCAEHDLIREAVYQLLGDTTRAALHKALAESGAALEPAARAAHYDLASVPGRARDVALAAASDATLEYAPDERMNLLQLALKNSKGDEELECAELLVSLCIELGQHRKALAALERIRQPLTTRLQIKRELAVLKTASLRDFGSFEQALSRLDAMLAQAAQDSKSDFVEGSREKLRLAHEAGAHPTVVHTLNELVDFAAREGHTREAAKALCFASYQRVFYDPGPAVEECLTLARSIAEEIQDHQTSVRAMTGMGLWLSVRGRTTDAAAVLHTALAEARRYRLLGEELQTRALLMCIEIDGMRFRRALRHGRLISGRTSSGDQANAAMLAMINSAVCHLEMGSSAEAARHASAALLMESSHPDWLIRVAGNALQGLASLEHGHLAEAIACRDEVVRSSPPFETWMDDPTYPLALIARLESIEGRPEEALVRLRSVATALEGRNIPGYWGAVVELARVTRRMGWACDQDEVRAVHASALAAGNSLVAHKALALIQAGA